MLRLILGKAGSGKTAAVIGEIREAVEAGQGGRMLLVPEQYSHEAERELCAACGDRLSLYAEVFSFTGLARRIRSRQGGAAATYLDKGGRLLCMALAMDQVGGRLKVYTAARRQTELHSLLLQAVDELKSACIRPEALETAARAFDDGLGDKLSDLALIASAYDAVVARGHADPADRLTVLAEQIRESDLGPETHVYVDGFIDFTRQEQQVLTALLSRGVEMTVCMTLDDLQSDNEIYALSRIACRRLLAEARALGMETRVETLERETRDPALAFFADNMFRYGEARWEGAPAPVRLCAAESL
ncbi:MAG: ATP-dependent nuclease subunit B, partial [Oscillospiraceae bacterium]|nr:ATP-dependent nuclease subunit B [Oscillospiraceae bacterium]